MNSVIHEYSYKILYLLISCCVKSIHITMRAKAGPHSLVGVRTTFIVLSRVNIMFKDLRNYMYDTTQNLLYYANNLANVWKTFFFLISQVKMSLVMRKPVLRHMKTTKVQTSLCILTVWSVPLHTCHKLSEICEIRQIFKGGLIKFCEIFTKII